MACCPAASGDNDGHGLAAAYGDGDVFHANGDRVSPDGALMQHLDPRAFDEAELDQAAFELGVRQRGAGLGGGDAMDHERGKWALG